VVTGEHPEPPGVVRQCLGDPELHGEVGDGVRHAVGLALLAGTLVTAALIPARTGEVPAQVVGQRRGPGEESLVGSKLLKPGHRNLGKQAEGITQALPCLGAHGGE
jgi:hypothetical protein